jgi:hypothetical protein
MKSIVKHPEPEMQKRENQAYRFYALILNPDEYPNYAVLDDDDMRNGPCQNVKNYDEKYKKQIIEKISKAYGVKVTEEDLWLEFWQFLDYLEANKKT